MGRKTGEKSGSVWKGLQNKQPSLFFWGTAAVRGLTCLSLCVIVTAICCDILLFVCTFLRFQ